MKPRLVLQVGGPDFHPAAEQAHAVLQWQGPDYNGSIVSGRQTFATLDDCDLLVLMGSVWTGLGEEYEPLTNAHKEAFESYIVSGRPLFLHHAAIVSWDDWPRYGELCGFVWERGVTNHAPVGAFTVDVLPTGHPVVHGVPDFEVEDELYHHVKLAPGLQPEVHGVAEWQGRDWPMIMTHACGRVPGAGKVMYLANGHDMRAFNSSALPMLWKNGVKWLLTD